MITKLQYYRKNRECKAATSRSDDCICWHDKSTLTLSDSSPDVLYDAVSWRVVEYLTDSPESEGEQPCKV